jgi:hypothetical protein
MIESSREVINAYKIRWTPCDAPSVKKISSIEGAGTLSYLLI